MNIFCVTNKIGHLETGSWFVKQLSCWVQLYNSWIAEGWLYGWANDPKTVGRRKCVNTQEVFNSVYNTEPFATRAEKVNKILHDSIIPVPYNDWLGLWCIHNIQFSIIFLLQRFYWICTSINQNESRGHRKGIFYQRHAWSIHGADQCGSIKIALQELVPMLLNKDLFWSTFWINSSNWSLLISIDPHWGLI